MSLIRKEIWFARCESGLYYGLSNVGEPPHTAQKAKSVSDTMKRFKRIRNLEIVSVGICPAEFLGRE